LYSPGAADIYKDIQCNAVYGDTLTNPEIDFLEINARPIMSLIKKDFNFIDLGPGTEYQKQSILLSSAQSLGKHVENYIPVDVNYQILDESSSFIGKKFNVDTVICQSSFEKLHQHGFMSIGDVPNFIYLGPTFMNFGFERITEMIDSWLKPGDIFFGSVQHREGFIQNPSLQYAGINMKMLLEKKLSLLGLTPDEYQLEINDKVTCLAHIRTEPKSQRASMLKKGDTVLTMMSIKYEKKEIIRKLKERYDCRFYDDDKFLGFSLYKK